MAQVVVTYPDEFELAVQTTREEMDAQIRLMAALKMFELGKLSLDKAAELAGLSQEEFSKACALYHVPVPNCASDESEAELRTDLETLNQTTA
jgi:predicted HTH domain antitoxin